MAKKILAVVLAVAMALSAMAVTVFADKQIPLYPNSVIAQKTDSTTHTLTIDIPVYTQYGWSVQYDAVDLYLPTNLGAAFNDLELDVKWNLVINGTPWAIEPLLCKKNEAKKDVVGQDNVATGAWGNMDTGLYKQTIYFGAFTHGYINGQGTTVPQAQSFGGITSMRLTAEITTPGAYSGWQIGSGFEKFNDYGVNVGYANIAAAWNAVYGGLAKVQYKTLDQATGEYNDVPNSVHYLNHWEYTSSQGSKAADGKTPFVSGDLTGVYVNGVWVPNTWVPGQSGTNVFDPTTEVAYSFTWDHNIQNRGDLLGAEKVQLVVELDKPLNGIATYSLYGRTQAPIGMDTTGTSSNLWMYYESYRKLVATTRIDGPTEKLVFDVPVEYLVDSNYGAYNDEFVIFETVELKDTTLMADGYTMKSDITGINHSGSAGSISWNEYGGDGSTDPTTGRVWAKYQNQNIVYAANGAEFSANHFSNAGTAVDSSDYGVIATSIYLNIVETPAEPAETETVDQATEGGEGQGDDVNVGDTEGEDVNVGDTEPEQNPTTGVALAVVPMLVAAAAAVVCKKH